MNIVLLFIEILVTFGAVVLAKKIFGEKGLTAWMCIATVLANIMTAKTVGLFGMDTTLGTVLFASTFLATDILTECYGKEVAKKAVIMAMLSAVVFIISSQIALLYSPSPMDYANESMLTLFSLNLRISISSVVMFFIANYIDVILYDKLRSRMQGKKIWLRNNICTIVCNGLENFVFIALAFAGIYSWAEILVIAGSTTVIEIIAAVCDTPFLYLARGLKNGETIIAGAGEQTN